MGYRYLNGRVNSASDVYVSCKNFVNFGPVTPEKTGLICILFFTTWQKTGIFIQISQDILGPIFTIFSPYESALSADDINLPCFPICRGKLFLGKYHERRLIPLAFFALSFVNELQYHCLNVRANSGDDVAISCKNLVNFCQVTPEIMKLI